MDTMNLFYNDARLVPSVLYPLCLISRPSDGDSFPTESKREAVSNATAESPRFSHVRHVDGCGR